ncbi:aspartyl/asparaginyl beta-hydroxylase domain-containing protein [Arenimonas caeni]|jgi:hypothetical protein|uniref:aspartyl/asparaginyl beta-hydroxylase domain-containing protein n=1 Tax=Arenimonas caeni TaxID=2058085 RepID=UPI002A36A3CC|nr:aspartyl/asparaginyl beta-hydroxylase domain-containing protein [Arenimonas caeni]MDY0021839.1 aspartyl/asparaginyl beta-hydroxylase domain-containing protein [Arenimonas caeni]
MVPGIETLQDPGADRAVAFARLAPPAPMLPALQAEVAALLGREWIAHVNQRDYRGGWDVLPLRCQRQHAQAHPVLQGFAIAGGDEWQDLPVLDQCPAIRDVLAGLHCPLRAARLMRLRPGAEILPHRDRDIELDDGQARLHVPVFTSPDVSFQVAGLPMAMAAGELWYFNAALEHAVRNDGRDDRIHLVVDCLANTWLHAAIAAGQPVYAPAN